MKRSFWETLKKPFFILAPMEGVTDTVFRRMVARVSPPDVFMTEFTSADGICSTGFAKVAERLMFTEAERPIVAQIWGNNPEHLFKAAEKIRQMNFDGVDINMGCPVKEVLKSGGGSALIGENLKTVEIIQAVKEGSGGLPVSVKTRIGRKKIITEEWIGFLLSLGLAAVTIHARTAVEQSLVSAHWEEVRKAVYLRDRMGSQTLVIGNGDVKSRAEGVEKSGIYGADGIMIGRGIFSNMAIFNPEGKQLTREESLKLLAEHARLFEKIWNGKKNFAEFRKDIKIYVQGFIGALQLRNRLMTAENADGIRNIIKDQVIQFQV